MYVCHLSLVHPAKAAGWNEMAFGRVTPVEHCIQWAPVPLWEREIWGSEPPVCSDAIYHQITLALANIGIPVFARLLRGHLG